MVNVTEKLLAYKSTLTLAKQITRQYREDRRSLIDCFLLVMLLFVQQIVFVGTAIALSIHNKNEIDSFIDGINILCFLDT